LEASYNPNLQNVLKQTAELLRAESDYLEAVAREAFEACRLRADSPDAIAVERRLFYQHHLALRRRILRLAIAEISGGTSDLYFNHFESMLKLIEGESPNASLSLPNGLQIRRAYNQLIFQKTATAIDGFEYEIAMPGRTELSSLNAEVVASIETGQPAHFPDGKFQAVFDFERVTLPLKLRNRREGDRFQPFGMQGSKKVKDFLIDAKVPQPERERASILVCGDEILWVVGHRTSEQFKVGEGTKRYLYLTYRPHATTVKITGQTQ
jgi:tRNA(Ile)-lysidine synthase